jgi:CheW-like domain
VPSERPGGTDMDMTLPPLDGAAQADSAPAQRIEYARGHFAALPMHTAIELVDAPRVRHVPGAAYYCDRLLAWRDHWLPLLDLRTLLEAHDNPYAAPMRYALVVAWQPAPGAAVRHGALALPAAPVVVSVSDATQCALPIESDLWPWIASACFAEGEQVIPVLDTTRLFSRFLG